jgi:rhodanese-related sulfurtransferase
MVKRITPAEAAELMKQGWSYVDVRSVPEFEQGHPEGASNIPLLNFDRGRLIPNAAFQSVVEACFPKDAQLVMGCKVGGRSMQAAALLQAAGYTNVVDMSGGFAGQRDNFGRLASPGWVDAGLPVEVAAPDARTYAALAEKAKQR